MIVTITHSGYIKRTNSAEYRVQARGGKGVKAATTKGRKRIRKRTSSSTCSPPRTTTT
ncbi:MAG: DNA gyrase C-terminal beta-propeller domain-containing protein [Akkermansia sp.]